VIGLLVASLDQPGVLYRLSEVIFRHDANIEYIAGGARRDDVAELQIEVSGAADEAGLVKDLKASRASRACTWFRPSSGSTASA